MADGRHATVSIYQLRDPRTMAIRYVGIAANPRRRLASHVAEAKNGRKNRPINHRSRWIRTLLQLGLRPVLEVIESTDNWALRERYWIKRLRGEGHSLTNLTDGGEGTFGHTQSLDVRAKHSSSRRDYFRLPQNRRAHSLALTGHAVSDETRKRISLAHQGKVLSGQHKQRIGAAQLLHNESLRANGLPASCAHCGSEFRKLQAKQRFCSPSCRSTFGVRNFRDRRKGALAVSAS